MLRKLRLRGMSLLETLISFTLFVTVMVVLMGVWVTHARAIELTQDQEVATNLAQMFMEQALDQGYAVTNVTSSPFLVQRFLRGVTYDSTFLYSVNVTDAPNGPLAPSPGHRVVVVKVEWQDSSANHTVMMESNATW